MKNTQYNGQKTRDKNMNDQPQYITQKTKDWATWTPQKSWGWTRVLWKNEQFKPTGSTRRVTLVKTNVRDNDHKKSLKTPKG